MSEPEEVESILHDPRRARIKHRVLLSLLLAWIAVALACDDRSSYALSFTASASINPSVESERGIRPSLGSHDTQLEIHSLIYATTVCPEMTPISTS
jgi:hypothetical protein